MDQATGNKFVNEMPENECQPESCLEADTVIMETNEDVVEVVPDIQSEYTDKTGNAKSKIQKSKTKKITTVASMSERKNLKGKAVHPPTSEMVMDSIKALKKRNGASFEDIRKYMEEKYAVDMRIFKYHVNKYLQKSVDNGILEKFDGGKAEGRFKIMKSENMKKDPKKLPHKKGKGKAEKKMAATNNQVKK